MESCVTSEALAMLCKTHRRARSKLPLQSPRKCLNFPCIRPEDKEHWARPLGRPILRGQILGIPVIVLPRVFSGVKRAFLWNRLNGENDANRITAMARTRLVKRMDRCLSMLQWSTTPGSKLEACSSPAQRGTHGRGCKTLDTGQLPRPATNVPGGVWAQAFGKSHQRCLCDIGSSDPKGV